MRLHEGPELSATGERNASDDLLLNASPAPAASGASFVKSIPARPSLPTAPHRRRARAAPTAPPPRKRRGGLFGRLEAFISRLSTRNNFWHRVCSLIWLPYAFRSGIRMKRLDASTFTAVLPFRRFNKNWYNAMAGAALLGNSEIAGGNYVFSVCGGDYTVVCKHLEYKFLRPCHGPAEYRMTPLDDIHALVATGEEFNIAIRMDIVQVLVPMSEKLLAEEVEDAGKGTTKPKRVGRCTATFHVTPKAHHKAKKQRGTKEA